MNDMHSLGRLIADAQDRNGWSLRDLQTRAERKGYEMSHTNFGRLKSNPVTSIKGENITMLAAVLQVPVTTVAAAALESMGVVLSAPLQPSVVDVVQTSPDLTEYDQALLTAMLDVMLGRPKADDHDHDQHPTPARERAQHDDGEDAAPAGRRGAGRRDAGPRQKTSAVGQAPARSLNPADYDLAAHPPMELTRDRQDREWGDVGEENQDHDQA